MSEAATYQLADLSIAVDVVADEGELDVVHAALAEEGANQLGVDILIQRQ